MWRKIIRTNKYYLNSFCSFNFFIASETRKKEPIINTQPFIPASLSACFKAWCTLLDTWIFWALAFTKLFAYSKSSFAGIALLYSGWVNIILLSVFNIFSFGHYYVNVILYSFVTIFGAMAIYRVMTDVFPGKKMTVLLATFLVPSFLYWTSGIHKEGLIFTGIGLIVYSIYFGLKEKRWGYKRILSLIAGFLLLLSLRNF